MFEQDMGRFVAKLIDLGHRAPVRNFKDKAMELLAGLIPFDMALWASGYTKGMQVHNVYLRGLPPELMESWERFKQQDRLLASVIAEPGITRDVFEFYAHQERRGLKIYQQHSRAYGIESALCTALPEPRTGLLDIMSLYRGRCEPAFNSRERAAKQFAFPLLTRVWRHNQIEYVRSRSSAQLEGGAAAVCDREGWLRQAEDQFTELIQSQWPEWVGPILPEIIREWLKNGCGKALRANQVGLQANLMDDLILLVARSRKAVAMLTPREEEVAESFAAGLTYKEISQEYAISPSTVRRHLDSIYKKLGVANKIELFQILNPD